MFVNTVVVCELFVENRSNDNIEVEEQREERVT